MTHQMQHSHIQGRPGARLNRALIIIFGLLLLSQTLLISRAAAADVLETGNGDSAISLPEPAGRDTLRPDGLISILAVGDIMLGTNYPSVGYLPPNDGRDLLLPVTDIITSSDLAFGNLEGVLLTGKGHPKKCGNSNQCYAFKSPDHYVNHIKAAGFDLLSLANNHSNDFGEPGRKNTIRLLDKADIHHAGLLERPFVLFEYKGLVIGFCAFAPNKATVKLNDHKHMKKIVSKLKSQADIVIVSFHGGGEGKKYQHVTRKTEHFVGENRGNPFQFARDAIDAGADLVLGHGPHVPRAVDLYKDRFIAYSLGNFATYSRFNLSGANGLAPILQVRLDTQGKFVDGQITSALQLGEGGPVLDENHGAARKMAELTEADFPKSPLSISPTGIITRKDRR